MNWFRETPTGAYLAHGSTVTGDVQLGAESSVWFAAAFLRLKVAVAHGLGGSTRVHVGGGVMF